jgi:predicted transcriptional regulator of viral defense system
MDLFTMQSKICKSSKDINIFKHILYETDSENIFKKNISKFSKQIDMPRSTVSKILKKFIDVGLAKRVDRGEYLINPFAFQAKGSTNELIENAQIRWKLIEQEESNN